MTQSLAIPLSPSFALSVYFREIKEPKEKEIENEIEKLLNLIIKSRRPLEKNINNLLSEIFDLKIKLLKWAIKKEFDFQKISQELLIELEQAKSRIKKEEEMVLFENTLFSLKVVIKVLNSILKQYPLSDQKLEEIETDISYEQLKVAIKIEPISERIKNSILKLVETSLSLDFALILAILFILQIYKFSKKRIIELSKLIKDLAQEYGGLAINLQLWKPDIEKIIPKKISYPVSQEIIQEEKELADAGISDYLKQIIDEEENELL